MYGVDCAILIKFIHRYLIKNESLNENYLHGRYWVSESVEELAGNFPFWKASKVKNLMRELVESGVVVKKKCTHDGNSYITCYTLNDELYEG